MDYREIVRVYHNPNHSEYKRLRDISGKRSQLLEDYSNSLLVAEVEQEVVDLDFVFKLTRSSRRCWIQDGGYAGLLPLVEDNVCRSTTVGDFLEVQNGDTYVIGTTGYLSLEEETC